MGNIRIREWVFKSQSLPQSGCFILSAQRLGPATCSLYSDSSQTGEGFDFPRQARALCAPAYSVNGRGHPVLDPVVNLKTLMLACFEDIAGERGIVERWNNSISLGAYVGYDLTQTTPDHSTLSLIRSQLGEEVCQEFFLLLLSAFHQRGLRQGKNVGIDTSVIVPNLTLKSPLNRNTQEAYWEHAQHLTATDRIEPEDPPADWRFDRRRPKKVSNEESVNPHESDAKVAQTKDAATGTTYKPEHTANLDAGAITHAEVRLGDEADHQDLSAHVLQAQVNINRDHAAPADCLTLRSATTDKRYHGPSTLQTLQAEDVRTVISGPVKQRNWAKSWPAEAAAVRHTRQSVGSHSGENALRWRGMHFERSFAHILNTRSGRRTTLRGLKKLHRRCNVPSPVYNLSQLMRKLPEIATAKHLTIRTKALFWLIHRWMICGWHGYVRRSQILLRHTEPSQMRFGRRVKNRTPTLFQTVPPRSAKLQYINKLSNNFQC